MNPVKTIVVALSLLVSSVAVAAPSLDNDLRDVPDCSEGSAMVTESGWLVVPATGVKVDFHGLMDWESINGIPDSVRHSADDAGQPIMACRTISQLHYFVAR